MDDSEKIFTQKSILDISANASPSENFSSGNSEEEEKISKVFSFEDFYSYPTLWEEEDPEEEDLKEEISNPEEEEKISEKQPDLEEEDDKEGRIKKILISLALDDAVSLRKERTTLDDAVLLPRITQYRLFPNDAVPCKWNDAVLCAIEEAPPNAFSLNDAVPH